MSFRIDSQDQDTLAALLGGLAATPAMSPGWELQVTWADEAGEHTLLGYLRGVTPTHLHLAEANPWNGRVADEDAGPVEIPLPAITAVDIP